MQYKSLLATGLTISASLAAPAALAHTGHASTADFLAGALHPFQGADHLAVILAVGGLAALRGGVARWALPLSFLAFMAFGATLVGLGLVPSAAELMVQGSVVAMAGLLLRPNALGLGSALALTGLFALFHGAVHAIEIAPGQELIDFGVGFLASTAALLAAGVVVTRWAVRVSVNFAAPARAGFAALPMR